MALSHYDRRNEQFKVLWMACAGPLADVPNNGDCVFYFPKGHMKQEMESTSQEIIGLRIPNKILCSVLQTSLMVDPETDQVYALITLHPLQPFEMAYNYHPRAELPNPTIHSFCKILTNRDMSTHGALFVPTKHANRCLPPLDLQTPVQELMVKDLLGNQWCFRHIVKETPRVHLITGGWHDFVRSKRLVVGDAIIFMRCPNDELRLGIRRLGPQMPATSISETMHLEVLYSVSHALCANTKFDVYYNPTRASPFIVGLNEYLRGNAFHFATGIHVVMRLKDGDCPENEKSHTGVIVEKPDLSSEWESLKVRWNEPPESLIQMPERVSPWQVVPVPSPKPRMSEICGCLSYLCDLIFRSRLDQEHDCHVIQTSLQECFEDDGLDLGK